jgi:DNA helicase-2/ATP-dependent DNA helicase PcrA
MTGPLALTAEQRVAVEAPAGPHVLTAPPGSGKTEVLVRRAIWLLEQSPDEVFRILALTYTTKAADELRERVGQALADAAWRVTAATFHSFCLDMLTHYGEPVGVPSNVAVYDDELRYYAFVDALREAGLLPDDNDRSANTAAIRSCLAAIDRLRVDVVPPDLAPHSECLPGVSLAEAYEAYDRALEAAGALDFSAMLFRGHQLLVDDPWVARHYRRLHRHVLVDEAHDLNRIQYDILRVLFLDGPRNVFLVADDDQEIFTFTGASSEFVRRFHEDFGASELPLSTNFRSAQAIVDAAEQLKGHFDSTGPPTPPMVPATPAPGWVGAWSLPDEDAEAAAAVDWVQGLLAEGLPPAWLHDGEDPTATPERIGVIGRTRYAFDHVMRHLDARELSYALRTEEGGLFDSATGRAVYFSLRVLANPRDGVSRRRLQAQLDGATETIAAARETPAGYTSADHEPLEFLHALGGEGRLPASVADVLTEKTGSVEELVHGLSTAAIATSEAPRHSEDDEAELWQRDREHLQSWWKGYAATTNPDDRTLSGLLRHLARLQRTAPAAPGIRLLTSHRAKGLQFRAVVVLGLNDGTFPFYRAVQHNQVDQERRAFYVAVTRAERGLLLTRPRSRVTSWGNVRSDPPSRFVTELDVAVDDR